MKIYKCTLSIILVVSVFFLTGCTYRLYSLDDLIKLPSLTTEYYQLKEAFSDYIGCEYEPSIPNNGSYQYSFILHDLTGDSVDDAVVFYYETEKKDITKIAYLINKGESWFPVGIIEGRAFSVDKVMFGDVNFDGVDDMIVGWSASTLSLNKNFICYSFSETGYKQYDAYPYIYLDFLDVDYDGKEELFSLSSEYLNSEILAGFARVYTFNKSRMALDVLSETRIDGNVSSIISVSMDTKSERKYIYIESLKSDNESLTDIICWDDSSRSLLSPFYDSTTNSTTLTMRKCLITSFDINGDNIIDIPTFYKDTFNIDSDSNKLPYSTVIKWFDYVDNDFNTVQYSVYNYKFKYLLNLPSSWVDRLYIIDSDGQLDFYYNDNYGSTPEKILFTVNVYNAENKFLEKDYSAFSEIGTYDNLKYVYFITDFGLEYGFDSEFIKNSFIIKDFG